MRDILLFAVCNILTLIHIRYLKKIHKLGGTGKFFTERSADLTG